MLVGVSYNDTYARNRGYLLGRPLRIAAGHHDLRGRIDAMDPADSGSCVLIGGRRHRTCVKDDDVSVVCGVRSRESPLEQLPFDRRAVCLRRAASEILNVVSRHCRIIRVNNGALRTTLRKV